MFKQQKFFREKRNIYKKHIFFFSEKIKISKRKKEFPHKYKKSSALKKREKHQKKGKKTELSLLKNYNFICTPV